MFGTDGKIRIPEESACEKLQNETAFQSSMFGDLVGNDIVMGATMDSACGADEDIVIGETMDSACGADPDVSPIGLKSYEVGDILHCSDVVTTPIVSQSSFISRAHYSLQTACYKNDWRDATFVRQARQLSESSTKRPRRSGWQYA